MGYFLVFNTRGIVLHEEGVAPVFLDSLIGAIDLRNSSGEKRIRDVKAEYRICGNRVYLSVGNKESLDARTSLIESILTELPENTSIDSKMLKQKEADFAAKKPNQKQQKREKLANRLNFSSSATTLTLENESTVSQAVKNFDIKKAFRIFVGSIELNELEEKMKKHLMSKNMESSYATILAQTVVEEYKEEGKTRISEKEFKAKMKDVVKRLIPMMDHQKFIEDIKSFPGLFVICFVGVNGVGKSTSLAKVAKWLIENDLTVYIAACDTFRAGAVEQLKVHVERFRAGGLDVGFYESGYAKDDASVAKAAIIRATRESYKVLLIDTAGRMHNKENMMKSLGKLIQVNEPNHIIFVGEALVGGDSLKHVQEFNSKIRATGGGRKINSILLTKVDTVDDKIGQIINLSFSASSPVIFLGTGQRNADLIKMDPETISDLLIS